MRLTKAQNNALFIMWRGCCVVHIVYTRGGGEHAFYGHPHGSPDLTLADKIRPSTVRALERKGLIRNITPSNMRWRGNKFILTYEGDYIAEDLKWT